MGRGSGGNKGREATVTGKEGKFFLMSPDTSFLGRGPDKWFGITASESQDTRLTKLV